MNNKQAWGRLLEKKLSINLMIITIYQLSFKLLTYMFFQYLINDYYVNQSIDYWTTQYIFSLLNLGILFSKVCVCIADGDNC